MENREKLASEFFQLLVKLNRSNKLPNERTNFQFELELKQDTALFYACLDGDNQKTRLLLAQWTEVFTWETSNLSEFKLLEEFITEELNNIQKIKNIEVPLSMSNSLKKEIEKIILEKLKSLGIFK